MSKVEYRGVFAVFPSGRLGFFCPGCGAPHTILTGPADTNPPTWTFDGDYARPTIAPSIRVTGVVPLTDDEAARVIAGEAVATRAFTCHSFVRGGEIEFLNDSTHALAGRRVALEPYPLPAVDRGV